MKKDPCTFLNREVDSKGLIRRSRGGRPAQGSFQNLMVVEWASNQSQCLWMASPRWDLCARVLEGRRAAIVGLDYPDYCPDTEAQLTGDFLDRQTRRP